MTREGAIGNLTHAIRWNDMPKKEALEMAIKALEQRLIPVNERLPEIKRDVLVSLKNGRFFVAALFPCMAGQDYRWIGEEEISFLFCDVEAWMPLPETYQESEDE